MKHIYTYMITAALAALALAGCRNEESIAFNLDTDKIASGADGGRYNLKVSAQNVWVASTEAPWITISPANGNGSVTCQVQVDSAVATTSRTAEIRIEDQVTFDDKVITVTQEGYRYTIMPQTTTFEIPNYEADANRYFEVKVKANMDFLVSADQNWVSVPGEDPEKNPSVYFFSGDRGERPRECTVRVNWEVNTNGETNLPRKAVLTFTPATDASISDYVTDEIEIVQDAATPITGTPRQKDSTALMAIARSLNVWDPWDGSSPMSTWSDVRLWEDGDDCPEDWIGRVRYVRFYMCGTENADCIPYEVRYLEAAEELVFYSNNNKERLNLSTGPYLSELANLKRLTIAYFGLTKLDPSITELKNLEYLNLAGNNFQTIPSEIFTLMDNPDFHALLLNTNYRSLVYDLSNATNLNNLGGFYDETEEQFHRLLMHEKLDTLTLGVNYFRGSLPTFLNSDGTVEAGVRTYDQYLQENPGAADSLSVLTGKNMPCVLPNIKYFTLNNNRLTGMLPKWLLYHPNLDWIDPFTLVFAQEGSLPREEDGTVINAGFDNVPIDFDYEGVEGADYGGYYDLYTTKELAPNN